MENRALGLIEVIGYTPAIEAADAALKAANVRLVGLQKVSGGIVTIELMGDVGAVKSAVEAGAQAVSNLKENALRASHIIPRISDDVEKLLGPKLPIENKQSTEAIASNNISRQTGDIAAIEPIIPSKKIPDKLVQDMSVKELKDTIQALGIQLPENKLNAAKRQELIQIITQFNHKEGDK